MHKNGKETRNHRMVCNTKDQCDEFKGTVRQNTTSTVGMDGNGEVKGIMGGILNQTKELRGDECDEVIGTLYESMEKLSMGSRSRNDVKETLERW